MKKCMVKDCDEKRYANITDYCRRHYERWKRHGHTNRVRPYRDKTCIVKNCNERHSALGYCQHHYHSYRNYGSPFIVKTRHGCKGEKNPRWNGGTSDYPNHYEMKKMRKIILAENPICQHCKKNKAKYIHHLDRNKSNHKRKNLIPVCAKCHMGHYHYDSYFNDAVSNLKKSKEKA